MELRLAGIAWYRLLRRILLLLLELDNFLHEIGLQGIVERGGRVDVVIKSGFECPEGAPLREIENIERNRCPVVDYVIAFCLYCIISVA